MNQVLIRRVALSNCKKTRLFISKMTGADYHSFCSEAISQVSQPLRWILTLPKSTFPYSEQASTLGVLLSTEPDTQLANQGIMTNAMTRASFKQHLQRQQLEQEEKKFSQHSQSVVLSESESIAIRNPSPTTVPSDVPSSVLQVSVNSFKLYVLRYSNIFD